MYYFIFAVDISPINYARTADAKIQSAQQVMSQHSDAASAVADALIYNIGYVQGAQEKTALARTALQYDASKIPAIVDSLIRSMGFGTAQDKIALAEAAVQYDGSKIPAIVDSLIRSMGFGAAQDKIALAEAAVQYDGSKIPAIVDSLIRSMGFGATQDKIALVEAALRIDPTLLRRDSDRVLQEAFDDQALIEYIAGLDILDLEQLEELKARFPDSEPIQKSINRLRKHNLDVSLRKDDYKVANETDGLMMQVPLDNRHDISSYYTEANRKNPDKQEALAAFKEFHPDEYEAARPGELTSLLDRFYSEEWPQIKASRSSSSSSSSNPVSSPPSSSSSSSSSSDASGSSSSSADETTEGGPSAMDTVD